MYRQRALRGLLRPLLVGPGGRRFGSSVGSYGVFARSRGRRASVHPVRGLQKLRCGSDLFCPDGSLPRMRGPSNAGRRSARTCPMRSQSGPGRGGSPLYIIPRREDRSLASQCRPRQSLRQPSHRDGRIFRYFPPASYTWTRRTHSNRRPCPGRGPSLPREAP